MMESRSDLTPSPELSSSVVGNSENPAMLDSYYTIAIMSDHSSSSPVDNSEMMTSYSNPNYTLNDALNSNLPVPTPDNQRSRGEAGDATAATARPGHGSGDGSSDEEATRRIVRVTHGTTETPGGHELKGFLGYYASLESAAYDAYADEGERDGDDDDDDDVATAAAEREDDDNAEEEDDDEEEEEEEDDYDEEEDRTTESQLIRQLSKKEGGLSIAPLNQKPAPAQEKQDSISIRLPAGWERHEDGHGAYYWHIRSGNLTRKPPTPPPDGAPCAVTPPLQRAARQQDGKAAPANDGRKLNSLQLPADESQVDGKVDISSLSNKLSDLDSKSSLIECQAHIEKYASVSLRSLSQSVPGSGSGNGDDGGSWGQQSLRFAVQSLGWVGMSSEELTQERSSRAVNKCIIDMSRGRRDINDTVGRWGEGKDLYMELHLDVLLLVDPQDMHELHRQPVSAIRVWGVGRDNGRDFAYVARDKASGEFMCHVFRCDTPARHIANALRDICNKLILKKRVQNGQQQQQQQSSSLAARPSNLPNLQSSAEAIIKNSSFPTPMEEPKKVIRCHYLGSSSVSSPTGVEVLNSVMERVFNTVPAERWMFVSVAVAPSTITICEHGKPDEVLVECRVRYLSFMGIALRNVKLCGFINHTADNQFVCHVFHSEPSGGALCKTIEAACKLRFQKALDAHRVSPEVKKDAQSKGLLDSVSHSLSLGSITSLQNFSAKAVSQGICSSVSNIYETLKAEAENRDKGLGSSLKLGVQSMFGSIAKATKSSPIIRG